MLYATSVRSLSLFIIAPSSDGSAETGMPVLKISQTLIESVDNLLAAKS